MRRIRILNEKPSPSFSQLLEQKARDMVRRGRQRGPFLRFIHVNDGIDGSADHAGQLAAPFSLDVYAGLTYHFESKT